MFPTSFYEASLMQIQNKRNYKLRKLQINISGEQSLSNIRKLDLTVVKQQSSFNIWKWNNVIHLINKLTKENDIIFTIDGEKKQWQFMIKISHKLGIKENILNQLKCI